VSVGRASRFDSSPLRFKEPRPWTEDYVLDTLHLVKV